MSEHEESWTLTVIRSDGLYLMRPEKSWRPIVTAEFDKSDYHEVQLGCDGQNPNLRNIFTLHGVTIKSKVEFKVWHHPKSKKKGRKRILVASAKHCLGDLIKRRIQSSIEVRLHCQSFAKRHRSASDSSRVKPALYLKLSAPSSVERMLLGECPIEELEDLELQSCLSGSEESFQETEAPATPSEHEEVYEESENEEYRQWKQKYEEENLLHMKLEGYKIDSGSDDDVAKASPPPIYQEVPPSSGRFSFFLPSLLPRYSQEIKVDPNAGMNIAQRALTSFTVYKDLKDATLESHYSAVFTRVQAEWIQVGQILCALAAIDTAVMSLSSDSLFSIDSYARISIAAGSTISGLGIASVAWFLFRYNWAPVEVFRNRALDVYDSYFFFSLSARVPALCMFFSAILLFSFLGLVAFEVWPIGVAVVCFLVGILLSLQFLVYGIHWVGGKVHSGVIQIAGSDSS